MKTQCSDSVDNTEPDHHHEKQLFKIDLQFGGRRNGFHICLGLLCPHSPFCLLWDEDVVSMNIISKWRQNASVGTNRSFFTNESSAESAVIRAAASLVSEADFLCMEMSWNPVCVDSRFTLLWAETQQTHKDWTCCWFQTHNTLTSSNSRQTLWRFGH